MRINAQTQLRTQENESTTQQASTPLDVSVVIPCLNEANSLAFCVEKAIASFRQAGLRGEVIVADNGSTDGSIEIAESNGAKVLRVSERGYGAALIFWQSRSQLAGEFSFPRRRGRQLLRHARFQSRALRQTGPAQLRHGIC